MKALKIVAGVVAVLVVGIIVVLMTVDVSQYKGVIQDQAKAATGREVTIGDIKLSLSLTPAIVVTDVKVANASWGSRPDMLVLKRLEARTQLIPLLFGTINISGLKLVEPDAFLETNAQGKGNWEFDTPAPPAGATTGGGATPLNVSGLTVEGLKLQYRDGKTKAAATVAAKAADVDIEGDLEDLNISSIVLDEASASYTEGRKSGQASLAELALDSVGPITDFNITRLALKDAKGSYKDGPSTYEGSIAAVTISGAPRTVAARKGAVDVVGALKAWNVTALALEQANVALTEGKTTTSAAIAKVSAEAKGRIGDLGITTLVLTDSKLSRTGEGAPVEAEIANLSLDGAGALALTAKLSGKDVKASGTLAPVATLAARNKGFPAKVAFEGLGLKGNTDIAVTFVGNRPAAKGTITIPELDLAALIGAPPPATDRVFSDEPLPWDSLSANDANVQINIGKLTLPNGLVLNNVVLPVSLAAGRMVLNGASFAMAGGSVTSDVTMDANDKSFALKSEAKGISAETVAREMRNSDLITQGPLDVNISVRGVGNTSHEIASTLGGSAIIGMGESRIRSGALNIVGADIFMQVLGALNPLGNKDPYTVARCGVVNLQIANGVATTDNGIALVTDKMQLTSSGTINFGTERVDLNVRPRATGGIGVGLGALAQAVKVSGPLSAPGVAVDKAGAVKTLGTLGAAFATGGLSALAQGAKNRVDGAGDPCQVARTWHLKK